MVAQVILVTKERCKWVCWRVDKIGRSCIGGGVHGPGYLSTCLIHSRCGRNASYHNCKQAFHPFVYREDSASPRASDVGMAAVTYHHKESATVGTFRPLALGPEAAHEKG